MHEMGIVLQILEIAVASIPREMHDCRVSSLKVKIGKLTAVVPESLRFCFDIAVQDTPLAGARLEIEEVPVVVNCCDCGAVMMIERSPFLCARCRSGSLEIVSGRELMVDFLEMADPVSPLLGSPGVSHGDKGCT